MFIFWPNSLADIMMSSMNWVNGSLFDGQCKAGRVMAVDGCEKGI